MKKLLIAIVILCGVTSISYAQLELQFTPSESSKMKKEWLEKYIVNNIDTISLHCDSTQLRKNEYSDSIAFMVLIKENNVIVVFNYIDSSYIISPHKLPSLAEDDDDCSQFYMRLIYGSILDKGSLFAEIKEKLGAEEIVLLNQKNFQLERKKL